MQAIPQSLIVPYENKITESSGLLSRPWQAFFRLLKTFVDPFGQEKSQALINNKTTIVGDPDQDDIVGLNFDKTRVSFAAVEYLIQRTTSTNESVGGGLFIIYYKPRSATWEFLVAPTTAGITLSVTADGQVQYVSNDVPGTHVISRIVFRVRTLAGKHSLYSLMGS